MKYWEAIVPVAKEIAWDELNATNSICTDDENNSRKLTNTLRLSINLADANARIS